MELIGKQIAIETILGQPPELHYPSWYAAQIEKLPPAPPEYLAEQAGILVTDADTISRKAAIEPPSQPKRIKGRWISSDAIFGGEPFYCSECGENTRDTVMGKPRWNFCPNCGADMREVTE